MTSSERNDLGIGQQILCTIRVILIRSSPAEGMNPEFRLVSDEPAQGNLEFGFGDHAEFLAEILLSNDTPKPFVIGIHGEWGSGKTTFLKELMKKLEKSYNHNKPAVIYFSSWEYERADAFTSLLYKISNELDPSKNFLNAISRFAFDSILRKVSGMTFKDAKDHFGELYENITTIRGKIKSLINKDVVLIIDDLDRCNVENVLTMLEGIKWFLTIDRVLVVIAVDMEKIERAWELRYSDNSAKGIGRDHTEKMFQLKLSMPPKSYRDLTVFVGHIRGSLHKNDVEYFVNSMPTNPRKLKLGLNLYQFTMEKILEYPPDEDVDRNYVCTLITWIAIHSHHPDIAEFIKTPEYIIDAAIICSQFPDYLSFQDSVYRHLESIKIEGHSASFKLREGLVLDPGIIELHALKILEICCTTDKAAFNTLREYGSMLNLNFADHPKDTSISSEYIAHEVAPFYRKFKSIINDARL